jgi:hypothetical protein
MSQSKNQSFIAFLFAFLLIMSACNSHPGTGNITSHSADDTLRNLSKADISLPVPVRLGGRDSVADYDLEDHLFGKFYGDRAGFYIIKNPSDKIFGHKVNSITLLYLDGRLYKTKYVVEDNIANDLINLYPRFYIRGFDEFNRRILKNEEIYYRGKSRWYLNDNLTNYDIRWKIGDNIMRLRINKNDPEESYQYIVKNQQSEKTFSVIEQQE